MEVNTMEVQISCINKDGRYDPHEAITHVGGFHNGKRWKLTRVDAVRYIEDGTYKFYVNVNNHPIRVIVVVSRNGNKYLKTVADGDEPNNLLALDECSIL